MSNPQTTPRPPLRRTGALLAVAFGLAACTNADGGVDRPADATDPDQDEEDNSTPVEFGNCGYAPVGDDEQDVVLDRGKEGWPQGTTEDPDGTIHAPFTSIRPIDYTGGTEEGGGAVQI